MYNEHTRLTAPYSGVHNIQSRGFLNPSRCDFLVAVFIIVSLISVSVITLLYPITFSSLQPSYYYEAECKLVAKGVIFENNAFHVDLNVTYSVPQLLKVENVIHTCHHSSSAEVAEVCGSIYEVGEQYPCLARKSNSLDVHLRDYIYRRYQQQISSNESVGIIYLLLAISLLVVIIVAVVGSALKLKVCCPWERIVSETMQGFELDGISYSEQERNALGPNSFEMDVHINAVGALEERTHQVKVLLSLNHIRDVLRTTARASQEDLYWHSVNDKTFNIFNLVLIAVSILTALAVAGFLLLSTICSATDFVTGNSNAAILIVVSVFMIIAPYVLARGLFARRWCAMVTTDRVILYKKPWIFQQLEVMYVYLDDISQTIITPKDSLILETKANDNMTLSKFVACFNADITAFNLQNLIKNIKEEQQDHQQEEAAVVSQ